MSLAAFTFTRRARPVVELGIGDVRAGGGQATWSGSRWDDPAARWSGIEPTWLDISCDVHEVRFEYGRRRTTERFVPGMASILVDNSSGWADPHTVDEPGVLTVRPGRSIRVVVDHDELGRRVLWRGYVDSMTPRYHPVAHDTVELACVDALGEVNRAKVTPTENPVGEGESASARVTRILDLVAWPVQKRDIAPAAETLKGENLGGQIADLLGRAADSAGGVVFGDREARVAFRGRDWQTYPPGTPLDGTIGNVGKGDAGSVIPGAPGYLTPTVGTVTTTDPGPLPKDVTFVVKLRGPTLAGQIGPVVGQTENHASDRAWLLQRRADNGNLAYLAYSTGAATPVLSTQGNVPDVAPTVDELVAVSINHDDVGTLRAVGWHHDGTAWISNGGGTNTPTVPRDSALPVRIGRAAVGAAGFEGRIYSVELRTGLDPAAAPTPITDAALLEPFNDYTTNGWILTGTPGIVTGRTGTAAQLLGSGSHAIQYNVPAPAQSDTWVVGFAFRIGDAATGVIRDLVEFRSETTLLHNRLRLQTNGSLIVTRGLSTAAATSSGTNLITPGAWYYVEMRVKLHDTAGEITVKLNGVDVINVTGVDTKNGGTKTVYDTLRMTISSSFIHLYDDLYLKTAPGASFPGPITLPPAGSVLWRFDANEYPGGGVTSYTDPRGRTWTLTDAAAITPKVPGSVTPPTPPDVCPVAWERPFARADLATRAIMGRDVETAVVRDDPAGIAQYGIEPFERTDLLTLRDSSLEMLAERVLRVRSAATSPRVRSVTLNARTAADVLDLMTTVDPYKPSRYRCRLELERGLVFDGEYFATGVAHTMTPREWTLELNLDAAEPFLAAGGRWDAAYWDHTIWTEVALAARDLADAIGAAP